MSLLKKNMYQKKLKEYLSTRDDEAFIQLLSALVAVMNGNSSPFSHISDIPRKMLGAKLGDSDHIPHWNIETLVNELLVTQKKLYPGKRKLSENCFHNFDIIHNCLLDLENEADGLFLRHHDVLHQMSYIAQLQFPWQWNFRNLKHLYRSIFLYGGDEAGKFFQHENGISISNFILVGFCFFCALSELRPIPSYQDMSSLGISESEYNAALLKFSIKLTDARRLAKKIRKSYLHPAYQPSVLRDFPIIAFGQNGERLSAPIPELIAYRYTSGLYLDVVKGKSPVWTGIGKRFEQYSIEYLTAMMKPYTVEGEKQYGSKSKSYRSPDILISNSGVIKAVIECKAKRMDIKSRFPKNLIADAAIGLDEIAKGIFQLWRFFSHARLGKTKGMRVDPACQAILLTLDSWLVLAPKQKEEVFRSANVLADNDGNILPEDRREIAFCQIEEVEAALESGTPDSFLNACREISSGEKKGWSLHVDCTDPRPYPFADRLKDVLPWLNIKK